MRDRAYNIPMENLRPYSRRAAKTIALSALTTRNSNAKRIITTKKNDYTRNENEIKRCASTKASIFPIHDIGAKSSSLSKTDKEAKLIVREKNTIRSNPSKKQWKEKENLLAVAEVTPHRSVPPPIIDPPMIKTNDRIGYSPRENGESKRRCSSENRTLKNNDRENNFKQEDHSDKNVKKHHEDIEWLPIQKTLSEPLILAKLNLKSIFRNGNVDSINTFDGANRDGGTCGLGQDDSGIRGFRFVKVVTYSQDACLNNTFPVKLYHMVHRATLEHPLVCRWSQDGKYIAIQYKDPVLLSILRLHFKHSRWLSFSRQLNNYGFSSVDHDEKHHDRKKQMRFYYHPKFHRDITDPTKLTALLPYLPSKRKRGRCGNATASTGTKKTKRRAAAEAKPSRLCGSSQVKTVTPLTKIPGNTSPKSVSTINHSDERNKVKAQTTKISKKTHPCESSSRGKDFRTLVNFLKTPSPRHRSTKATYMSSPPPLSHYLQPKQGLQAQQLDQESQKLHSEGSNSSSENGSPLPTSLLTVDFVMTPLSSDEPTPRTHNLSSSLMTSSSSTSVMVQSPDGVRMLSWAAQAVESPEFHKKKDRDKLINNNDGKTASSMNFAHAIGCSPIVPVNGSSLDAAESVHRCHTTTFDNSSTTSCSSPAHCTKTFHNDGNGPSPLCFNHHEDNEVELEFLRNCLEDVFVTGSDGNTADDGLTMRF